MGRPGRWSRPGQPVLIPCYTSPMSISHWTLLGPAPSLHSRRHYYYKCSCGTVRQLPCDSVNSGKSKSCGCQKTKETFSYDGFKSYHPLRNTHAQLKRRCLDPSHHAYHRYGGKGITLHEEWLDFSAFASYIDKELGPRPAGHSLDRIRGYLGYVPGNVRWATNLEQSRNR